MRFMSAYQVIMRDPKTLVDHPQNREIWGRVQLDDDFVESIRTYGIRVPIVVAKDGVTIISGHRRVAAAIKIGVAKVPCKIDEDAVGPEAMLLRLLAYNKMRVLTNAMMSLSASLQMDALRAWGAKRPIEQVADNLGVSERTAKEAVVVGDEIRKFQKNGEEFKAHTLTKRVNKRGFRAASEAVKPTAPKAPNWANKLQGMVSTVDEVRKHIDQIVIAVGMCDEADQALRNLDDARKKLSAWQGRLKTKDG